MTDPLAKTNRLVLRVLLAAAAILIFWIVWGIKEAKRRPVAPPPAPAELTDEQKAAESCRMLRYLWNGKSESEIPRGELQLLNRCDSLGL